MTPAPGEALPSRDRAWQLLTTYTAGDRLRKHALAVEAVMRAFARLHNENEELYGLVGLLHDFDYEQYPDIGRHTIEGARILAANGFPSIVIDAILSHVTENALPRDTLLKKAIFACDELTGFVVAVALVKGGDLSSVTPASVVKKLRDKGFARGVHRPDVTDGAELLGVPLEQHIAFVVDAMKPIAPALGLMA